MDRHSVNRYHHPALGTLLVWTWFDFWLSSSNANVTASGVVGWKLLFLWFSLSSFTLFYGSVVEWNCGLIKMWLNFFHLGLVVLPESVQSVRVVTGWRKSSPEGAGWHPMAGPLLGEKLNPGQRPLNYELPLYGQSILPEAANHSRTIRAITLVLGKLAGGLSGGWHCGEHCQSPCKPVPWFCKIDHWKKEGVPFSCFELVVTL